MSPLSTTVLTDSIGGASTPPGVASFDDDDGFPILLRRYRLGLALFVLAIAMLFIGFSSAYVVRRGIPTYDATTGAYSAAWEPLQLPIALLIFNTAMLVCASLAMERTRRALQPSRRSASMWLNVSLLLSVGFIVGQGIAWYVLRSRGHWLISGARTAFFYLLTGTHAVHALAGCLVLVWIAVRHRRWSTSGQHIAVDLSAWYMYSMTVLWIYLFCFLLFA